MEFCLLLGYEMPHLHGNAVVLIPQSQAPIVCGHGDACMSRVQLSKDVSDPMSQWQRRLKQAEAS